MQIWGLEGGGGEHGGGEDLPKDPPFSPCLPRGLQAGAMPASRRGEISGDAPGGQGRLLWQKPQIPPFVEFMAGLYFGRAAGEGRGWGERMQRDGGGRREKGTNLQLALQSGMRRMHKQPLCSAPPPPPAPLTSGPPNSYPGSQPPKAAELLHEYS